MKIKKDAKTNVHFEFDLSKTEIEIYVDGWFITSVDIEKLSKESRESLIGEEGFTPAQIERENGNNWNK